MKEQREDKGHFLRIFPERDGREESQNKRRTGLERGIGLLEVFVDF